MVAILFVVMTDRGSQEAYRLLMNTSIKFIPFQIKGKNVRERLKNVYKIDQVPTLYITTSKKKYVGISAIRILVEKVENDYYQQHIHAPPAPKEEIIESSSESSKGPPKIPRRDDSVESNYSASEEKKPRNDDEDMPVTNPEEFNRKKPAKKEEDSEEVSLEF